MQRTRNGDVPPEQRCRTCIAFVDTMTLLHYQWIDQIDWPGLLNSEQVVLAVAPVVLRELDKHKESHPKKRIRGRAANATRRLLELLRNGERRSIRQNVTVSFLRGEPSQACECDGLDFRWDDDRLLGHVVERTAESPDEHVVIVSDDSALQTKAILRDVTAINLPDELLLPIELDEQEKRIQELERENRKLTDRVPKISVCFPNKKKSTEVKMLASSELLENQIGKQMDSIRQRYAKISTASAMGIIEPANVQAQNVAMERFYKDYEAYLKENFGFWHRVAVIDMLIRNMGNCPAYDVDVVLTLPESVTAVYNATSLPELLAEPKLPKRKSLRGFDAQVFASIAPHCPPEIHTIRAIPDLANSSAQNVESPVFSSRIPLEVHYHVKRVKHNLDESLGPLYLQFASVESAHSFQIACAVTVGNVPTDMKDKLNVKVDKVPYLPGASKD